MNKRDYVGNRGEILFRALITDRCGEDEPWFQETFLGEKHSITDFLVTLVNPTSGHASFYVQVKATKGRYTGTGPNRKLRVGITKAAMKELKQLNAPAFVVGVDIVTGKGYAVQITRDTPDTIPSIPLSNPLDCTRIKRIWEWVDQYWSSRTMLPTESALD
jgi:hypothetical protein